MITEIIRLAAQAIKKADYLLITTGAGMGVDSGMPDYRGSNGFWNSFPPYTNKFTFIECANPRFMHTHPELFWGFYGTRLNLYRNTTPHYGHDILQKIAKQKKDYFVVTSNVDGHMLKFFKDKVYEVHGSIHVNQCSVCSELRDNSDFIPLIDNQKMSCSNVPKCPRCNGVQRPNVLMFGDSNWNSMRSDNQRQNFQQFVQRARYGRTVIVEIGAGDGLPTIRRLGGQLLNQRSTLIRINPQENQSCQGNLILVGRKALEALVSIVETSNNKVYTEN